MKKSILFIYNPKAGKGKIRALLPDIIELFNNHCYEVVVYATRYKRHAEQIVEDCLQQQRFDYVVCSGGDGTLNEVINGTMNCDIRPKIGYIPSGTVNDFAYTLRLPKNMMEAAKTVLVDSLQSCDVGSFNESYFVYNAAFGLFSDVSYKTAQSFKKMLGRIAYLFEGVKRLSNLKAYHIDIILDEQVISEQFIYGMVANTKSVGGFRGITGNEVMLDDGKFEGIFIRMPHNILDLQDIINHLRKGNLNCDLILSLPVKKIHFRSEEEVPWVIDGEYGGQLHNVRIENNRQAVSITALL
ncbi:MAG TPA: diacylglycerol kinase family protein [Lachnospiraceae bacterium]|nr:diacylglycerol kinase family protein [Lachnospiraceae bacterium]